MNPLRLINAALIALVPVTSAFALDFRSVADTGTVFYRLPSTASSRLAVASRFYPVEVVLQEKNWARVRDVRGEMGWVEVSRLSTRATVIVTAPRTTLRREPADAASALLVAVKDVALEVQGAPEAGWVKVRYNDRITGFVRLSDVWGI